MITEARSYANSLSFSALAVYISAFAEILEERLKG